MTTVRWTRSAQRDYRNIIEWIGDRNPAAAVHIADVLDSRVAMLARRPRIGRIGRIDGTRELVITRTPYLIIYEVDDANKQVVVLRLLHTAQRWPPKSP